MDSFGQVPWDFRMNMYKVKMSLSVTMPIPIEDVQSSYPTHKQFTQNNTNLVITLDEGVIFETDFDMSIRLSSPHSPQLYLETGPDKQVAAFVLRPDFAGVNLFADNTAFSEVSAERSIFLVKF